MRRTLKYLRIAVTALSLTACVLLVALWVLSYSALASVQADVCGKGLLHLQLVRGNLVVFTVPETPMSFNNRNKITRSWFSQIPYGRLGTSNSLEMAIVGADDYSLYIEPDMRICRLPAFAPVLFALAGAFIPWMQWSRRFSLRALLIATTLVAMALAAIVVAAR